MLYITQQQKLQQRLSPQQIQYIKLLQLPSLALEQAIKAELEQNPALEEALDEDVEFEADDENLSLVDLGENPVSKTEEKKSDKEEPLEIGDLPVSDSQSGDEFNFEDYFQNDEYDGYKTAESGYGDDDRPEYIQPYKNSQVETIRDQLGLLTLSEKEFLIADLLLGSVDPDGYLRMEIQKLADDFQFTYQLPVTIEEIEAVRLQILELDPIGFCSTSLKECLLVQLKNRDTTPATQSAIKVLTLCFDAFTKKHYEDIQRICNLDEDELRDAYSIIQRLNPKPGDGDFSESENYVIPDFFIENINGELLISLNEKGIPPLRINRQYLALATSKKTPIDENTKSFIKKKVEDAKWFRQSIIQRRETMLKVMNAILDLQSVFFRTGENIRPMILKDVADIIEMDISTVSRVVNSKYVQTEYGVYSLKYFFSEGIETSSGEDASSKEVKLRIKEIIETEEGKKPFSDDKISAILKERGYNIARRTVTKYRESQNIPVARLRKKI